MRFGQLVVVMSLLVGLTDLAAAAGPSTTECLSASERSLSLRNEHKLRDARTSLLLCSSPSCPTDIRNECIRRVAEINAGIPTIVFEVRDSGGSDLVDVGVKMDGELLAERLDGIALPVDPGAHAFTFETKGRDSVEVRLIIRQGEKDRHEKVTFKSSVVAPVPVATVPTAPPLAPANQQATVRPPPPSDGDGRVLRVAAWSTGALAAAAFAAGGYFSLRTRALDQQVTNAPEFDVADDRAGQSARTLQYVMYGVGAAAAASCGVLAYFAMRHQESRAVALAPLVERTQMGALLQVRF